MGKVELDVRYKEIISMSVDIIYNSELNVVSVRATGELNFEAGKTLAQKILKIAAGHECKKVLCNYSNMKLTATPVDLYNNADHLDKWGVPHDFWIAVIYSEDEKAYKFWEIVAKNRGYLGRVFKDKNKALKWLTNDTTD